MSEATETKESPRSSSAEAQSCAAQWRDERPTTPGRYEGRVIESGEQHGPVKEYEIFRENGMLRVHGSSVVNNTSNSIPLTSRTWDNYQWREAEA